MWYWGSSPDFTHTRLAPFQLSYIASLEGTIYVQQGTEFLKRHVWKSRRIWWSQQHRLEWLVTSGKGDRPQWLIAGIWASTMSWYPMATQKDFWGVFQLCNSKRHCHTTLNVCIPACPQCDWGQLRSPFQLVASLKSANIRLKEPMARYLQIL